VTRGVAPRQHSYPGGIHPSVMMYAWPKTLPDINTAHASAVSMRDFRWSRCDIKSTSLLGNVMANQYAAGHQCYETLFEREGVITESSHCNVFFVKDDTVYTHPTGSYILDGISRQAVLELCRKLNMEVCLEGVPVSKLLTMDEAFLTGTSTQILALKEIDGHAFFKDEPGPVTRQLQQAFLELKGSG